MAVFLSKCKQLRKLIPELQCHKCSNVPGPNWKQKNRYSCIDSSHTLCEKHKIKCPCGSLVGKNPSPVIAKLLQDLPWMCQNYKNGCREIEMNVVDLNHHQEKCIYRKVFCPNYCEEYANILFKNVSNHLTICMEKPLDVYEMSHEANKFDIVFEPEENNGLKDGDSWFPTKMTTTCGAVFLICGWIANKTMYTWICLLGSSDEAKKYSCTYSMKNEIGEKFIYVGPVHTLDKNYEDTVTSGSLLGIGIDAVKRSLNEDKELQFEITIRNLKEEAKDENMESGVSDGE